VYSTGCPTLATYCACKEFYDKTPKEKLIPVQKQYEKYLGELRKKMKQRRNDDRKTLKRIQLKNEYENDDMAILKKTYFENYIEDYAEEQFLDENPFENLDIQEESEDDEYDEASV
jgi:hypothetical protein